ncbi:VOC family protein [Mariniflexile sp. AS56]|uniref:SMU1112c/YaeR family gloxylase I-like metalloprotein n=1 Tax=Mariniflexile sp. AS56 TaxID=3063957 RepID=UPI0026EF3C36|nr:VOC family protein [Mariniflexile sp. AS56]MDO7171464.1 VOC family protein [Mariniflexile sp. AS56]
MLKINKLHHIAIICKDYNKSKKFYTNVLGFKIQREISREERQSYKLDLALNENYLIELFSFPNPPERQTQPESTGLRHIAFEVENIEDSIDILTKKKIKTEPIRIDPFTNKKFTFFEDPDKLPIEIYEL